MCGSHTHSNSPTRQKQHQHQNTPTSPQSRKDNDEKEPFPWHIGVFDAHCHPTDTMSSIPSIPAMQARCLTVMATRAQDQELVDGVADKYGVKSSPSHPEKWEREECIVPAFGWHPWFSYQMFASDEVCDAAVRGEIHNKGRNNEPGNEGEEEDEQPLTGDAKIQHYQTVLRPQRTQLSDDDRRIFESLPDPMPFSAFLRRARGYLEKHPNALVGEIGLDKSFRIPEAWVPGSDDDEKTRRNGALTPGGREGRRLTPFRVDMEHQKTIVRLQLQLAARMGRAVSLHGVQAHGVVFQVLEGLWKGHEREVVSKRQMKKRKEDQSADSTGNGEKGNGQAEAGGKAGDAKAYPPRVCLHSYSGNPDAFKQYLNPRIPVEIFASFSTAINLGDALEEKTPEEFVKMIKTVPDHMLLVESDLHTAGERMDERLEDIVRRICRIKGWGLEEGVKKLGDNWRRFVFGG